MATQVNIDALKKIYNAGHEIGTLGQTYMDYSTLTAAQMLSDLNASISAIRSAIGVSPKYFRAPYASINELTIATITGAGYRIGMFNLDTNDWKYASNDPLHGLNVMRTLIPPYGVNSIVKSWVITQDVEYLQVVSGQKDIISFIKQYGYKFVTISEADGNRAPYS